MPLTAERVNYFLDICLLSLTVTRLGVLCAKEDLSTCPENQSHGVIPTGARGDDQIGEGRPHRGAMVWGGPESGLSRVPLGLTVGRSLLQAERSGSESRRGCQGSNEWTDVGCTTPVRIKTPGLSPEAMTTQGI
jgi:hypothetical protein